MMPTNRSRLLGEFVPTRRAGARSMRLERILEMLQKCAFGLLLVATTCTGRKEAHVPVDRKVRVELNHVVANLDSETSEAIAKSAFLREYFAAVEQRTSATADGDSWTGFYLYGRDTSVEIFAPAPSFPPGEGAVGLGVDEQGGLAQLSLMARAAGRPFESHMVKKQEPDGRVIPWFMSGTISPERKEAPFGVWVMEYQPAFMAARFAGTSHDPNDVSRRSYLSTRYRPERWLENVSGAHFLTPARERDEFADTLAAYGWQVNRQGNDAIASNADVELRVTADANRAGLVELRFVLNRSVERRELALGHSTLTVGPGTGAVWHFAPVDRSDGK